MAANSQNTVTSMLRAEGSSCLSCVHAPMPTSAMRIAIP